MYFLQVAAFNPLTTQKVPSLVLFKDHRFSLVDAKVFLKVPLVPIYNNFEGGRVEKKLGTFGHNCPESALKRIFGLFFFPETLLCVM